MQDFHIRAKPWHFSNRIRVESTRLQNRAKKNLSPLFGTYCRETRTVPLALIRKEIGTF